MATLGTAYIQVLPSTEGISAKLQQGIGTAGTAAGKSGGIAIGSAMTKFIGAAAIGAAIKKSVEEGAKLEQSLGGVETLYGKHADKVIQNASKAYRTAGLSANDYMEQSTKFAASLLQSLGGDTQKAAKYADMAIIDMSDNANKFGTNITDIQNAYQGFAKQNYTMLDNLKLGYGGTKTEMERLLADASKISGQEYDISNLNDVYDAIHVIQTEMGVTGTTSKEAASTLSGSFASMKAAATNFLGNLALGKDVGKSLQELVSSASTFLFDNLIPALVTIGASLPSAVFSGLQTAIPTLLKQLPSMITQVATAISTVLTSVGTYISEAIRNIGDDPGALEAGMKIMWNIAKALVLGIVDIVKAFWEMRDEILAALKELAADLLEEGKKAAAEYVKGLKANLKEKALEVWDSLKNKIKTKLESIKTTVVNKAIGIKNAFNFKTLAKIVGDQWQSVKEKMLKPINKAKDKIKEILKKIKGFFPISVGKILSNIKLPHIKITKKSFLGVPYPSFSVSWYKKGAIFNGASVVGVGEAGKEAVVPLSGREMKPFADAVAENLNGTGGNNYYFGDITLDVSSLEDVATIEDIAQIFTRAKAFA